jgi:hypothetical protein
MDRLPVRLLPREPPLAPCAVAARGEVAARLARRLLACPDGDPVWGALRGVGAPDLLVLVGEAAALPWVDGVVYLGRDDAAPSLLMPTTLAPEVDVGLFERALKARSISRGAPLAVLVDPPALVALDDARTLARDALAAWLGAHEVRSSTERTS